MMKNKSYFRLLILFLGLVSCVTYSQKNSSNFFEISRQKELYFKKKLKRNSIENSQIFSKNYKKFIRWQWFWQNRVDKKGNLNTYNKELYAPNNVQKLRTHAILNAKNQNTWKIVGPEKYPEGTNPNGIKGIGRIDAIVVNPKNKNHVIIGARSGGVWETYNINDTNPNWICLTNNLPVSTVNDLKIINNTLYAATSNKNATMAQGDLKYGLGIIKKTLDSKVWELSNISFDSKNIAVSNKNPNMLYAVGEKEIYKSINAGDDWQKLNDPIADISTSKLVLTNIEINPNDDAIIIITGRLSVYDSTNNNQDDILIFKSENGGQTWSNLTRDLEVFLNAKFITFKAKDKPISLTKGKKIILLLIYTTTKYIYVFKKCMQKIEFILSL